MAPENSRDPHGLDRRITALADEVAVLPVLDPRRPDEILGYDSDGLPTYLGETVGSRRGR